MKLVEKARREVDAVLLPCLEDGEEWAEMPEWLCEVLGEAVTYNDVTNTYNIASAELRYIVGFPGEYLVCLGKDAYGYRLTAMPEWTLKKLYEVVE